MITILCGENYSGKSKYLNSINVSDYRDIEHITALTIAEKWHKYIIFGDFNYNIDLLVKSDILKCTKSLNRELIIFNPENNLIPKAQSRLADLYVDNVINNNNSLYIETNSEHLIYRLCYLVHTNKIDNTKIKILYFYQNGNISEIYLNGNGNFVDSKSDMIDFPTGFFDATLQDYMSIF